MTPSRNNGKPANTKGDIEAEVACMKRLTKGAAAWLLSISPRSMTDYTVPRNADQTYNAQECIEWLRRRLDGGSSAMEDQRRAKAELLQLELQERQSQLIDRQAAHVVFGQLGALIRKAGEKLQRRYGPEAQGIIDEALDEFESLLKSGIPIGETAKPVKRARKKAAGRNKR